MRVVARGLHVSQPGPARTGHHAAYARFEVVTKMHTYGAMVNLLPHLPLWTELLIFLASAGVIWVAGIPLSDYTDILSDRLHLGQALGGLILLAVATNLPEIAITYRAP